MSGRTEPEWFLFESAIEVGSCAFDASGGAVSHLRDESLLRSAIQRPINKWHYGGDEVSLFDLAAAYCFGIAKNHPFVDGNKRVSYAVAISFLADNGVEVEPSQESIIKTIRSVADGMVTEAELSTWFAENAVDQ